MSVVGIDLGTTYSVIAKINEFGKADIIDNLEGKRITPSVVFFENKHTILVGDTAKQSAELDPEKVVQFIKNHMGTPFTLEFFGKTYTPEQVSALILTKVKQDAEDKLGEKVKAAVITVPAIFGDAARQATKMAAEIAGLEVVAIIDEPVAAALSYGLGKEGNAREGQNIIVYDLGGGTFDITVMRVSGDRLTVLHTDGDRQLGGKLWDERIINHVADKFKERFGSDPFDSHETLQNLRSSTEQAKITLSSRQKCAIVCNHDGNKLRVEITRAEFEELTADLLERTRTITQIVIDQLIEEEKLKGWQDIHQVLLVGGSSRMPQVSQMMQQLSGHEPKLHDPDLAVAKGAALYAVTKLVLDSEETGDTSKLKSNNIDPLIVA